MSAEESGADALEALRWRDEILQALYWMRGEGLAHEVAPAMLADFLVAEPATIADHMAQLAHDGYLEGDGAYRLTRLGLAEASRSFRDAFGDYVRQGHMECGPGCWCTDPKHAGEPCPSGGG